MPPLPDPQAFSLLDAYEAQRIKAGANQLEWAERIGISQGHYSKIIQRKARAGRKVVAQVASLSAGPDRTDFETILLKEARATPRLQRLLETILDMHLHVPM